MSKDKVQKNPKKPMLDRASGKSKVESAYKNEGKNTSATSIVDTFHPKPAGKSGKST